MLRERVLSSSAACSTQPHCTPTPFRCRTHRRGADRIVRRGSTNRADEFSQQSSHKQSLVDLALSGRDITASLSDATAGIVETDGGSIKTQFIAETLLPTRHGKLRLRGYKHTVDGGLSYSEPTAIIVGKVEGRENVPVRVHDACYTSEVLGSLKCDCADQLNLSLSMIIEQPPGMVIYLQQEGRGIGLANKIAAYALQEQGLDTVDANRALGLPDDCREYSSVRNILWGLGVKSIQLITNNPRKINELKSLGLNVTGRIPCIAETCNVHNEEYLRAKQERMDHMLEGLACKWDNTPMVTCEVKSVEPRSKKRVGPMIQLPDYQSRRSKPMDAPKVAIGGSNGRGESSSSKHL